MATMGDKILLVDGVKYNLWTPKNEIKEFEPMVVRHINDIFGESSLYFDIKRKIKSITGEGSIPDGYLIDFDKNEFYIIENELSTHSEYDHINKQVGKFIRALKNYKTRQKLASILKEEVESDIVKKKFVIEKIQDNDIYQYFLENILEEVHNQHFQVIIIIDKKTDTIREACETINPKPHIIEFATYRRENAPSVLAHLFEPFYLGKTKEKTVSGNMYSERHYLRERFWRGLLEKANKKTMLFSNISPSKYSYIWTSAGKRGVFYEFDITSKYGRVEIYLDKGKQFEEPNINKIRFDQLYKHKNEIEKDFGGKLNWERLNDKRGCRISYSFEGIGYRDEERWDELQDKMVDAMIRLEKAFSKHIKKLD